VIIVVVPQQQQQNRPHGMTSSTKIGSPTQNVV